MSGEREVLSYEGFGIAARELAETVAADHFRPGAVIGIARGGLPLGAALAYALERPGPGRLSRGCRDGLLGPMSGGPVNRG